MDVNNLKQILFGRYRRTFFFFFQWLQTLTESFCEFRGTINQKLFQKVVQKALWKHL